MKVRFAIPNKGRLYEPTLKVLKGAGIVPLERDITVLMSKTSDPEIELIFVRTEDIPKLVEGGAADVGITGYDFIRESRADVAELLDLGLGKARLILAAPKTSKVRKVGDVKDGMRVATKFVNLVSEYFEGKKKVKIVEISGATEITPYLGIADLVVDTVSTGTTLAVHGLRAIDVIIESSARLIANKKSYVEKRAKISEIVLAIESVLLAEKKKLVMMNVPEASLEAVIKILPAMTGPTIAKVEAAEPTWEVYSVVDESEVRRVISATKKAGAKDIIVVPIERVVR